MRPAGSSIHQLLFVEPNDLCVTKTYSPLLMWCPETEPTLLQAAAPAVPQPVCPPRARAFASRYSTGAVPVLCTSQLQPWCTGKRKILFHLAMAAPVNLFTGCNWKSDDALLTVQLIGRWANFCVKPCKLVNGFRIIQAQYQSVWHASDCLFLFIFPLH